MKFLLSLTNQPLFVLLSSILGGAVIAYVNDVAIQALYWFIPCIFVIVADLASGIRSARWRKENIRISGAIRRTVNKFICYFCWVVVCVGLNRNYNTELWSGFGVGLVIVIEGLSFITNLLEPHGIKLSIKGVLKIIGGKINVDGLEGVIEEKQETK